MPDAPTRSSRVWTVPNLISMSRLLGVPLFLWLVLVPEADGWALALLMVAGLTDFLDGYLARKLNQRSSLGEILDPVADRLYILAVVIGLAARDIIPWWVALLLPLRDLLLWILVPFLRRRGYSALPVHFLGKAATFNLLYAFPLLLLGDGDGVRGDPGRRLRMGLRDLGDRSLLVGGHPLRLAGLPAALRSRPTERLIPMADSQEALPDHVTLPLLTLVTEQSLDQDYAQAAARRGAAGSTPPPRRRSGRGARGRRARSCSACSWAPPPHRRSRNAAADETSRAALIEQIDAATRGSGSHPGQDRPAAGDQHPARARVSEAARPRAGERPPSWPGSRRVTGYGSSVGPGGAGHRGRRSHRRAR